MKPVYFIAEVGKACNGDLNYCREILLKAKEIGANAVRFHHFSPEESVHRDVLGKSTERAWSFKLQLPFLREKLFSKEDYKTILDLCQKLKLDFIASPWDLKSFDIFKNIGVKDYKVNSINFTNIPLVKAILAVASKTYLSTGGIAENDVQSFCLSLKLSQYDAVLMHAALAYPAPSNIINIRGIEILQKFHPHVGYSSNDLTNTAMIAACALGASVIEKHVHLANREVELHRASIDLDKFAREIKNILELQEILSRNIKQEARGEMINHELLSKSIVVDADLPSGSILTEKNLTLQLPPKGVHSKSWFNVIGKRITEPLTRGSYLFSTQIEGHSKKILQTENRYYTPGKRGVVVRFKDIDEMIEGRNLDYVEVHYAAGDLKKLDSCKDYDLDLVVHLPEYADGKLLDLSSRNEALRQFSIEVINDVMERSRKLKSHFKRCEGLVKFVVHAGGLTYLDFDPNIDELNEIFLDSMKKMDTHGLDVLLENMNPFAWFLDGDWTPKQGKSNNFMDAHEIAAFCLKNNYGVCLDVCHAKLYCNNYNKDLVDFMRTLKPFVRHLHYSDCYGVDGEGLQIGDGENQWQDICEVFDDFEYGWTPEIWNGHLDRGIKFHEAHTLLSNEFKKYFYRKQSVSNPTLVEV